MKSAALDKLANNRPTVAAALGGVIVAVAGLVVAATNFTTEVDVAIGVLAVALSGLCGVVAQRGTYSEATVQELTDPERGDTDDPHVPPELLDLFEALEQANGIDR